MAYNSGAEPICIYRFSLHATSPEHFIKFQLNFTFPCPFVFQISYKNLARLTLSLCFLILRVTKRRKGEVSELNYIENQYA